LELSKIRSDQKASPEMVFHAIEQSNGSDGNDDCRAIEGVVVLVGSGSGVVGCCMVIHLDIEEGVDDDHFAAHVIGPLQDLGRM
jgi:hypothetical protein